MSKLRSNLEYDLRLKKPYALVHDAVTGLSAVYNRQHELISSSASRELVEFALGKSTRSDDWGASTDKYPAWAEEIGALIGARYYWLWNERSTVEHLRAIPDA